MREINEELWFRLLKKCLKHVNKSEKDIKSADWKVMIAYALKEKTSAMNVWLTQNLNMGIPQGVFPTPAIFNYCILRAAKAP